MSRAKKSKPQAKASAAPGSDRIIQADRVSGWILVALIALLPLVVRAAALNFVSPGIVAPTLDTGLQGDFFSYYKWIILLGAAVILNGILLIKIWAGGYELSPSHINLPLLILAVALLLSALAADHQTLAWVGLYNRHEGALTYLAYLSLFLVAANTVFKSWFARWTGLALGLIALINMAVALLALTGHDITAYGFIRHLIVPTALQSSMHGTIRSLLAHPNYSSGLSAALFAFFLTRVLLEVDWKPRLLYGLASLAAFAAVLASLSSSGFATLVLLLPVLTAACWLSSQPRQALASGGAVLLACLAIFLIMNAYNPAVGAESVGFMQSLWRGDKPFTQENSQTVPGREPVAVAAATALAQPTPPSPAAGVQPGLFTLPAPGMAPGSGRLYIWSEVDKLILTRPLLGYGLDTLPYYFPQNDINKVAGLNEYGVLVDKPHNFYLAIAYGAGLPALLAVLALLLGCFYNSGKRLWKAPRDTDRDFAAALFLFCLAYVLQWLFNDSVLGSAPLFWILLGAGVSWARGD